MATTLIDQLINAGLPASTIESFRRTVSPNAINESASTLDDEVRHVLRSRGEPLDVNSPQTSSSAVTTTTTTTPTDGNSSRYPPFVVCLAHHRPIDVFCLFVFSRDSIPRRLVRFDRDGTLVKKMTCDDAQKYEPYLWDDVDAKVMVAAVVQCKGYFVTDATDDDGGGGGLSQTTNDESSADCAECLRLGPRSKSAAKSCSSIRDGEDSDISSSQGEEEEESDEVVQESQEIRTIILHQLLNLYCKDSLFHHPDPNFLMPLSKAIALELKRWRELCLNVPPVGVWPDLPPSQEEGKEDDTEVEETEEDRLCGKVGTYDRDTFDEIMNKRKEQTSISGKLVKKALDRMRVLLEDVASMKTERITASFNLGRLCTTSLLSFVSLQRQHWEKSYECNEALGDICDDQNEDHKKKMDEIAAVLLDCYAKGKIKICEYLQEETSLTDKADSDIDAAASLIISDWKKDDAALLTDLSSAFEVVEEAIKSEDQAKQKAAVDGILSIEKEVKIREMKAHSNGIQNVTRLVKLWNADDDDDDGNEMWRELTPEWTNDQVEASISFGRRATASRLLFLVDQAGIADFLLSQIDDLQIKTRYDSDDSGYDDGGYFDDGYLDQADRFESQWKLAMTPILDSIFALISNLFRDGDLCNTSLLLVACCRILCRNEIACQLRGKFCDPDESYGANKIVMSLLRTEIAKFDICAIQLAFKYLENDAGAVLTSLQAGASWFYDVLKSGIISFPDEYCYIRWDEVTPDESCLRHWKERDSKHPWWFNFAHEATAIYSHRGWRHPILCHALSEDAKPEDIKEWTSRESPLVIKQRFLVMKDKNDTRRAISLAKMMQGDHEALHFLVSVGLASDAIEQANRSDNERGLTQLAFDLVDSDKRASFLCAQSHILRAIEKAEQNDCSDVLQLDSINLFVDLFLKKYLSLSISNNTPGDDTTVVSVSSLSHLSIMAVTREFLAAATSTSKMQGILERFGTKILVSDFDISFLLAVASLAVICQTAPLNEHCPGCGLKHALNRSGLLCEYDKKSFAYSGLLSVHDSRDSSSKEHLVRLSYAIFECSKYEMERTPRAGSSCGDYYLDFATGLLCATYVAINSRSHNLVLLAIQTIKTKCDKGYQSPLSEPLLFISLASSFSNLTFRGAYSQQNSLKWLLETALSLRVPNLRYDVKKEQIWVALAYKEYVGPELAGSLLAESAFFYQRSGYSKFNTPVKLLRCLSVVDMVEVDFLAKNNAMSTFALSKQRVRFSMSERQQMCSAYFYRLLTLASLSGSHIAPGWMAECVRIDSALNPSFWNINSEQVDAWLSQSTGLASCFSDEKGLNLVCQTLYFVESQVSEGGTWSTKYFIFACGLSWLRSVLLSTKLPEFDHIQEDISNNRKFNRFIKNNASLFEFEDWVAIDNYSAERHSLLKRPILSVYAIATIVEKHARDIEESSFNISHLCHEALLLCRIMFFLLIPNLTNFNKIANIYTEMENSRELSFQLPSYLEPENLLDVVLRCKWGMKGTFSCKEDESDAFESDSVCGTPRILPHFYARIVLALEQDRIKEAELLCISQGKSGMLWGNYSVGKNVRELVQACLLTLRSAAMVSIELRKDFVNIFTHIILTMNWFQFCPRCLLASNTIVIYINSNEIVPSVENIKALRNAASVWSNKDSESSPLLKHCARVVCCIDRCYASFESTLLQGVGCQCRIKEEVYDSKVTICPSSREQRLAQRAKRKRQRNLDVETDFKELHSYTAQIHSKKASHLINHVLPRIIAAVDFPKKRRFA